MPYNKVINEEIEDPIEDHVSSSAGSVAEELLRHPLAKRRIEEINYFRDYLRDLTHIGCKGTTFFRNMQKNADFMSENLEN